MLADGIAPEFLFVGCFTPLLLLLAVSLLEAIVAGPIMRLPWRRTFSVWLAANTASALTGLVVLWAFGGQVLFWSFVLEPPSPGQTLISTAPRLLAYFVESMLVEAGVWQLAQRRQSTLQSHRWPLALLAANVASYALLIPFLVMSLR